LRAQRVEVTGALTLGGRRPRPLAGAWAVLHQVSMAAGGPVDSVRTDAGGRYRLHVPQLDTAAMYVVSTLYHGVAYFSEPLRIQGPGARTASPIAVYDTVSSGSGPPIQLHRRLMTVARPKHDGTRDVLEILELGNPGFTTRIATDTLRPVWAGLLPAGVIQFQVGEGDFSAEAVERREDTVAVFGPVQPGNPRQLTFGYVIPADQRTLTVPIDQPTDEVDLLLEDTTARVVALGLESMGIQAIEQRRFARYRTGALAPGTSVTIELPGRRMQLQQQWWIIVVVAAAALGWALFVALKRKPSALASGGSPS
jgi:hypothetical protein